MVERDVRQLLGEDLLQLDVGLAPFGAIEGRAALDQQLVHPRVCVIPAVLSLGRDVLRVEDHIVEVGIGHAVAGERVHLEVALLDVGQEGRGLVRLDLHVDPDLFQHLLDHLGP